MKKTAFKLPYAGIEAQHGLDILFSDNGDYSVVVKIENPVLQYSANADLYNDFHSTFLQIIKLLAEGYVIQKQDVLAVKKFAGKDSDDFLTKKYFEHFSNREYTEITTYLTITKTVKRSRFFTFDEKEFFQFHTNIKKIIDILETKKLQPSVLNKQQIERYLLRVLGMQFNTHEFSLNNLKSSDEYLQIGTDVIKSITLIDPDELNIPNSVSAYIEHPDLPVKGFPIDTMSFLHHVPAFKTIIYNQIITVPNQRSVHNELTLKRKRHSSVPDPANKLCVDDIDHLLDDVAKENQFLVYAHYNIIVKSAASDIDRAANYIESQLFNSGIMISKNSYNQIELFRAALPGNASELKEYDKLLITADAGLCFFFKECKLKDEDSQFQIYFCDRQGIPRAIDPSDNPMDTNVISNRNRFVLGPPGSGKSFFMNHLIRQYILYNMDVVMVDTGHSYSGLCAYYGGRYITYSEEKPITMNPFRIYDKKECDNEKKDSLKSLVGLLWKGAEGVFTTTEDSVLSMVIETYYAEYFATNNNRQYLSFDSFYDYAILKIKELILENEIAFPLNDFKFVLKKFYSGGQYGTLLNDDMDASIYDERFIVFEIDNIKDNKVLFPIITMIIMGVFLHKMRHKGNRKALMIEEAWKAIASPMMAAYLVYVYKTVRKFFGEAVIITQELNDILGNPIVKNTIVDTSGTIVLLDQIAFKDKYTEIAQLLSLSAVECHKIFTINQLDNKQNRGRFKEVYIKLGQTGQVYGVENSIHEYLTFTTEKVEKDAVKCYLQRYEGNYEAGLEAFVKDFKASKLSLRRFSNQVIDHHSKRLAA